MIFSKGARTIITDQKCGFGGGFKFFYGHCLPTGCTLKKATKISPDTFFRRLPFLNTLPFFATGVLFLSLPILESDSFFKHFPQQSKKKEKKTGDPTSIVRKTTFSCVALIFLGRHDTYVLPGVNVKITN
jgi:hypothetical protein